MKGSIITIGDEILFGDTVDTNAAWLGKELSLLGIEIVNRFTTGDEPHKITTALNQALHDTEIVIVTGGLGPTNDDRTKECLANYFETELREHAPTREKIETYYRSRGRDVNVITQKMVQMPVSAEIIPNNFGVAPGLWFQEHGKHVIALPGIPSEMKGLMKEEILPSLFERTTLPIIAHHYFLTAGKGETTLADRIADIENKLPSHISIAYLPSYSAVKIRITGRGDNREQVEKDVERVANKIRPFLEDVLYSEVVDETLVHAIATLRAKHDFTIGVAESCTGGTIMSQITQVAGSSKFFEGGFVSYSNEMKLNQLGVNESTLTQFGAVSEQTVSEMVKGTLKQLNCNYALAVSGIAGPGGGSEQKPVGTVCIAVGNESKIVAKTFTFAKKRQTNIGVASMMGLHLLFRFLKENN